MGKQLCGAEEQKVIFAVFDVRVLRLCVLIVGDICVEWGGREVGG